MNLPEIKRKVQQFQEARIAACANLTEAETELERAEKKYHAAIKAQQIIQSIAATVQDTAHKQLASVVSRCLSAVFYEPYEFKINFRKKRGKTEAEVVFIRNGYELSDPMDEAGGGPIAVAAFALKLATILLTKPPPTRLLVMDEPFAHLSQEYIGRIGELMNALAEEMGFQFVLVTHNPELEVGEIIRID